MTQTYDPDRFVQTPGRPRRDRVGVQAFRRDHLRWYDVLRTVAPSVDVLIGGEPHRSGSLHGHALVAVPAGARWERPARWWFDRHGFDRWDSVRDPEAAGAYAAKYVVKDMALVGVARAGGRLVLT